MEKSDEIELLSKTITQDADGIQRTTETARTVFCKVKSATAAEVFDGGRNGLKPDKTFRVFAGDYMGETLLRHNGIAYSVYRTYAPALDVMELHAEQKVGGERRSAAGTQAGGDGQTGGGADGGNG